jgi:hypothetical protein
MRIISVIAVFTLATVVCADVTPSSLGVAEASSLEARSLRGEVRAPENEFSSQRRRRRRRRKPVDRTGTSLTEVSDEASVGGAQAPVRERRNPFRGEDAPSTEIGGGAASTSEQSTIGTRPRLTRQNGRLNLNPENTEETDDAKDDPGSKEPRRWGMPSSGIMIGFPIPVNMNHQVSNLSQGGNVFESPISSSPPPAPPNTNTVAPSVSPAMRTSTSPPISAAPTPSTAAPTPSTAAPTPFIPPLELVDWSDEELS